MKKILLFTLLLLAVLKANADSNIRIGDLYFTTTDGKTCVFDGVGPGTSGKVEVPAEFDYTAPLYPYHTYHNLKVVAVSSDAFTHSYEAKIKELVLPETITEIGEGAFSGCDSLKRVNIPSKVTELKNNFNKCKSLEKITIPASITSIYNSFNSCNTINELVILDSDTPITISKGSSFSSFHDTSIRNIYQGRNCINYVFEAKGVESLTIGDNVTEIYEYLYSENPLKNISFGKNITKIGKRAFYKCAELKEINLPESLTELGEHSFSYCSSITNVKIPSKITEISTNFYNCTALESITIPENVTSIYNSFNSCNTINELVILDSDTPITISKGSSFSSFHDTSIRGIYQGRNCINYVFEAKGVESLTIGDNVTEIYEYLYSENPLKNISFGKNITKIGKRAFYKCAELKEINLPESLTELGEHSFSYCSSITDIKIPAKVTEINTNFHNCTALESITIPENVTSIYNSFVDCDTISELTILDSDTPITISKGSSFSSFHDTSIRGIYQGRNCINYVFDAKGVESLTIGDNVTEIYEYLYSENPLKNISFGKNITKIGKRAFYKCAELKEINLPESLTELGEHSFSYCSSITDIKIPAKVTEINTNFHNCTALESITIPENVTSIYNSFVDCDTISELTILDSDNPINISTASYSSFNNTIIKNIYQGRNVSNDVFSYKNIEHLTIGNNVTEIAESAYRNNPLNTIIIGENIANIGRFAFVSCDNIESITTYAETAPECASDNVFSQKAYDAAKLLVPAGTRQAYAEAPVWKLFKNIGQSTCLVSFVYDSEQCGLTVPEGFDGKVDFGESIDFTVAPLEGYIINDVSAQGEYHALTPGNNGQWTIDSITGDITVSVSSEIMTFAVKAKIDPAAGSIAINGESVDSTRIAWHQPATLDIMLNQGYTIDSISIIGSDATPMLIDGRLTVESVSNDITVEVATSMLSYRFITDYDNTHGSVTVGGNTANEQIYTYGSRPEIEIIPDEGYRASWVRLNGRDILDLMTDNKFTTDSIKSDMSLSVGFEARLLTLSILGIEGGRVAAVYDYGVQARLMIIPDNEWKVNSIVFNGDPVAEIDLTDGMFVTPALTDDSELSVTFVKNSSSIDDVEAADDIRVYGHKRVITIANAPEHATAIVTDINGRTVYSGLDRRIDVSNSGVYLVTIADKVFKLML